MRLVDRASRSRREREKISSLLRSCWDLEQGKRIHEKICRRGLGGGNRLDNLLVAMYARCGDLDSAKEVFQSMPHKDAVARNAIIAAHADAGSIRDAKRVFDDAPDRNPASWAAIAAAFAHSGDSASAIVAFDRAPARTLSLCTIAVVALTDNGEIDRAKKIFEEMPERDVIAWNAMARAYSRLGQVDRARLVLERSPASNAASWLPLILAHASNGDAAGAAELYGRTRGPSPILCTALVKAYGGIPRELFEELEGKNVISWTALLDASAAAGDVEGAIGIFEAMPQRDAIASAAMLAAIVRSGDVDRASTVFELMPERDLAAWTTMIKACGASGDGGRAREIYRRMPLHDAVAGAALIAALSQSGHDGDSWSLFAAIPERDLAAWNTMIAACARSRRCQAGIELLAAMCCDGVDPDGVSFVAALAAHSHIGMLDSAGALFRSMSSDHGWNPSQEHYWAMIDVLARMGRIADAEELIETMPFLPDDVAWMTLERMDNDGRSSGQAADRALELNPKNGSSYVLLASSLRR